MNTTVPTSHAELVERSRSLYNSSSGGDAVAKMSVNRVSSLEMGP